LKPRERSIGRRDQGGEIGDKIEGASGSKLALGAGLTPLVGKAG